MAKTGNTPKGKPKARASRPARPAFTPAAVPAGGSAWVYRSDAATPPALAAPVVKPAPPRRAAKAPATAAPASALRGSRVTHVMDVVTMPIAVSLMAVLAPMRWLLGPASRH